jgi:hypothetical protein
MNRGGLLPFLLTIALGLMGGLYYSWVINPVSYVETAPASLRTAYREDYLALIASSYASTGDLDRAKARLALLPDPDPAGTLSQLAQTRLARGDSPFEARALAQLAAALGDRPTPVNTQPVSARSASPTPTGPTPTYTITPPPPPTRTPTATPGAPFELIEKQQICDPDIPSPLLQVEVIDAAGRPVPGVEVLVVWDLGQDHFFTGLKPELGMGYADFTMSEGVIYTLQLVDSEIPITGLTAEDCLSEDDELLASSWLLTFQQPPKP